MSLIHNISFCDDGTIRSQSRQNMAILEKRGGSFIISSLPVFLSTGKVKYPICSNCHTSVIWSYGRCRCGNIEEPKSGTYVVKSTGQTFNHSTWSK
ncbi:hypothetical protein GMAR_ORF265 [Golden Marseillevirus]|uniref:hypothetical protein n=1 Tax=Golden Marseillevirus TaxID=1720526 RepID=UPI000877A9B0|nr:hypothetical protein GMAR_ORF265 [Golden Marseillevirus]ALX27639.1 hypothetical protein GMAR_ORF265 [Golden Marseillevirus]